MHKINAKFNLSPPVKHGFHCIHFHETHVCLTAPRDHLYQMPPRHVSKCGKYGYTFIYTLMYSTNVNEPISKKSRMFYSFIGSFAWSRKAAISFIMSVCRSLCPHTSARPLFYATFMKICRKTPNLFQFGQKYRALYMKD
jgi:hypothetical protein